MIYLTDHHASVEPKNITANMDILEIVRLTSAEILYESKQSIVISNAFGSDLMSDVLRLESENTLLITGLANTQTIRTTEMADVECVLIVRGKPVTDEMIELAKENDITLLRSSYSLFKVSGILYEAGIKPLY